MCLFQFDYLLSYLLVQFQLIVRLILHELRFFLRWRCFASIVFLVIGTFSRKFALFVSVFWSGLPIFFSLTLFIDCLKLYHFRFRLHFISLFHLSVFLPVDITSFKDALD